jgi:hypothetical protein
LETLFFANKKIARSHGKEIVIQPLNITNTDEVYRAFRVMNIDGS